MISAKWNKFKLGDIAEIVGGGTPSTSKPEYWGGDIPWVTPRDLSFSDERFVSHGERSITEEGLKNSSTKVLPKGAVLLTTRAPIGYLRIAQNPICTNQGFKSLIPDEEVVNNHFLYYLLRKNVEYLKSVGVGSTFAEISGSALSRLEFMFPSLETQEKIVEILSALDEKIELNRQTNATLEAIAQAIFKEWFIDFNFPGATGEMVSSPLGLIPKGWKVEQLDKIASFLNGLALQKYPPKNSEDEMPVIKIKELRSRSTIGADKASRQIPEQYYVNSGDLLFSWSGTLEVDFWVGEQSALNQHLFKVTSEDYPLWFCYMWLSRHLSRFRAIAADKATTMGHIKREDLSNSLCVVPDNLSRLEEPINSVIKQTIELRREVGLISESRDLLLRKLMNTKIKV